MQEYLDLLSIGHQSKKYDTIDVKTERTDIKYNPYYIKLSFYFISYYYYHQYYLILLIHCFRVLSYNPVKNTNDELFMRVIYSNALKE